MTRLAPLPAWGLRLECGHEGTCQGEPRVGSWISCWAVCYPVQGCQTSRKVVEVWPLALFSITPQAGTA